MITSDARNEAKTQCQGDDRKGRPIEKQPPDGDRQDRYEPAHEHEPDPLDRKPDQTDPPVPGRTPVQICGAGVGGEQA